jgi:hypothetical protein
MEAKRILIILAITTILLCSSIAEEIKGNVRDESVQSMIKFLHESRHDREALSIRNSNIGKKAPPLRVKEWLVGRPSINKWPTGKLTVLEFWSTGCGMCVASIPKNSELAEWMARKGGLFVSIHSAGTTRSKLLDFLDKHPITYPVVIDVNSSELHYSCSKTFKEYGVKALPKYVTIGRSGCVLSYKRPSIQDLDRFIQNEPNHVSVSQKDLEIRKLVTNPKAWIASGLEPKTKIHGKFLIYRPDTPELSLEKNDNDDKTIGAELTRHTNKGQTIYDVTLYVNAPDWGQSVEGEITFTGNYTAGHDVIKIPYQLKSRGLVEYPSSKIHLGLVRKRQKVTHKIILRPTDKRNDIRFNTISTSPDVSLKIRTQGTRGTDIVLTFTLSLDEIGFRKEGVELLVSDNKGNSQPIKLEFSALVRE